MHRGRVQLKPAINLFDTFSEYAFAVRTLCDTLLITQDDLVVFPYFSAIDTDEKHGYIKYIRKIPIHIDIPAEMAPRGGLPYVRVMSARPPESEDPSSPNYDSLSGLVEYELVSANRYGGKPPQRIKFFEWRGSREYYPISSWCYFVHRKDYFEFVKSLLRYQRELKYTIKAPILPPSALKEIYENTIEFLQRGHRKREQYRAHNIPYKRGLLFCGPPGCVTENTKIKVRKISEEGEHEIYIV
jgi:hypothetical protein